MKIGIASGKGGTGKTSVSCALAKALNIKNEKLNLLDCDVEEPNVHIFFDDKNVESEKYSVFVPAIDKEKCTLCLKCEDICQFNAILNIGDEISVFPEMCHSCKGCKIVCEDNAILDSSKELGEIKTFQKDNIKVIYGELRIGEPMAPPLIDAIQKRIDSEFLNIIDAPPGTSCPVISAVKNLDYVILVTEPTPFGLNDLILAVETIKILKIPFGIIINRSDIGDDRVLKYAKKENIEILMEIPDDRIIAENYSLGKTIVEARPEFIEKFYELYLNIKKRF